MGSVAWSLQLPWQRGTNRNSSGQINAP
uniref:Uncharacterized protein n=1 Tax=Arundo donax TaxID=35708 RepID=A0A0A9HCU1_ARUDO